MKHLKEFTINEDFSDVDEDVLLAIKNAIVDQLKKLDLTDEILTKEKAVELIHDLSLKLYKEIVVVRPRSLTEGLNNITGDIIKNALLDELVKFYFN
jgi:hypothetical protein